MDRQTSSPIRLFLAGCGTVGSALVRMICENRERLKLARGKDLVLCGIANSRRFIADPAGLQTDAFPRDPESWGRALQERLSAGEANPDGQYIENLIARHPENAVFVDCTASPAVADAYIRLFRNRIPVVTCNKIANARPYAAYRELLEAAATAGTGYGYETTVCAALPVLAVIRQLTDAGDRILKMEAILSGTLNYLSSRYDGKTPLARQIEQARRLGYTEPDPRTDLSGTDVLRKFLIAAREAGLPLERDRIEFEGFLPPRLLRSGGADFASEAAAFYRTLETEEPAMKARYERAAAAGRRLRYTAVLETGYPGSAHLEPAHPGSTCSGTDPPGSGSIPQQETPGAKQLPETASESLSGTGCGPGTGTATTPDSGMERERAAAAAIRSARIGFCEVGPEHPFFHVAQTDNAVLLTSAFYPRGLLIQGAGAGPEQTAGGLLNDILALPSLR